MNFAAKGISKLAITYTSNRAAAEEALGEIHKVNHSVTVALIQADLMSATFAKDLVAQTLKELSVETIDVVVSNAALANAEVVGPLELASKQVFQDVMFGNAWQPVQLFFAALPHLPRGGRVIMISSMASRAANSDPVVCYGVSKAALDSFVRSLALLYSAKHGITVNSVSVGPTMTDAVRIPVALGAVSMDFINGLAAKSTAEKRVAEVEDISGIVGFLASDESRWINGNSIPANGGAMLEAQG